MFTEELITDYYGRPFCIILTFSNGDRELLDMIRRPIARYEKAYNHTITLPDRIPRGIGDQLMRFAPPAK